MLKMAPLVAQSILMSVVGVKLYDLKLIMNDEVKRNKFKMLDMMHHFTSGLKSLYSQATYDGTDLIRQNCGGAGYSVWSMLPENYFYYSPVPVYEGDNTVMAQQTLSYIQKKFKKIQQGKPSEGYFKYFNNVETLCSLKAQVKTEEEFFSLDHLDTALSIRAAWVIRDVLKKLSDKKTPKKVLLNDKYASDLIRMSKNHHQYMSFVIFRQAVEEKKFKDVNNRPMMLLLAKIYALQILTQDSVLLYESGFFGHGSNDLAQDCLKKACVELRPQMIPLVELKTDESLDLSYLSAIGNKYGDIYEKQLELAMNSRLNRQPKPEYWDTLVKPLMNRNHNAKL